MSSLNFKILFLFCSKTAVCRQRVMTLLPKVEGVLEKMAESEQVLMSLQEKRQRELWNLLKVACVRTHQLFTDTETFNECRQVSQPGHTIHQLILWK